MIVISSSRSLAAKQGLPTINALLSWIIVIIGVLTPILDTKTKSTHFLSRLLVIYLSFAPIFILLTVSYETIFYACFSMLIFVWMMLEQQLFFYLQKVYNGRGYTVKTNLMSRMQIIVTRL